MSLQKLVSMCYVKNELNNRRRRFYAAIKVNRSKTRHHLSREEAIAGYEKAKQDMKAMTREMRVLRLKANAALCWGISGSIACVLTEGGTRIYSTEFKRIHMNNSFEEAML